MITVASDDGEQLDLLFRRLDDDDVRATDVDDTDCHLCSITCQSTSPDCRRVADVDDTDCHLCSITCLSLIHI